MNDRSRHWSGCGLLLLLLLTTGVAHTADPLPPDVAPLISRPAQLIFHDRFDKSAVRPEWKPLHGTRWSVVDGALKGEPATRDYQQAQINKGNKSHSGRTPSSRLMVPTDDCIVLLRFKLTDKLVGAHFGFNDGTFKTGTGHVCRFTATINKGLTLQKDKNAKSQGDLDTTMAKSPFKLKRNTWYWMMLEIVGDQMAAQVSGGPVLTARHARIDIPKDQINLPTRGGGVIFYDDVRIWKALPRSE